MVKLLREIFVFVLLNIMVHSGFPFIILLCWLISSLALLKSSHFVARGADLKPDSRLSLAAGTSVTADYEENVMNTYGRYKMTISHGKGCKLFDVEGNEYLDCTAGIATCCLGHSHPALKKAVNDQMEKVHHVSNLYFIPPQADLAKWLVETTCGDKAFFCNSGAEANEGAIKLARKYAHNNIEGCTYPIIITAKQSFHGRTLTAITATGQPKYHKDFGPLTPGFEYVEYNNVEELREKVTEIALMGDGKKLAAIMMEPLQGEGGITSGDPAFFQEIKTICKETGALYISDEVQAGMGRTGKMWGYQHLGVEPDIITTAKALGGGVPIGGMVCKDACNAFGPGDHATTYGGNPLACAAGLAVANEFKTNNLLQNVQARGSQLYAALNEVKNKYPTVIEEIRGMGLIVGAKIHDEYKASAQDITLELIDEGLLVVPAGPKVVRFVPPLIISESEIETVVNKFEASIKKLVAKGD